MTETVLDSPGRSPERIGGRTYARLAADESREDCSLRYAPRRQAARAQPAVHRVQAGVPAPGQPGRLRGHGHRLGDIDPGVLGAFGQGAKAFSTFIALGLAMAPSPAIARATGGASVWPGPTPSAARGRTPPTSAPPMPASCAPPTTNCPASPTARPTAARSVRSAAAWTRTVTMHAPGNRPGSRFCCRCRRCQPPESCGRSRSGPSGRDRIAPQKPALPRFDRAGLLL